MSESHRRGRRVANATVIALLLSVCTGAQLGSVATASAKTRARVPCITPRSGTWAGWWDDPDASVGRSGSFVGPLQFTPTGQHGEQTVSGTLAIYGSVLTSGGAVTGSVECGAFVLSAGGIQFSGTFVNKTASDVGAFTTFGASGTFAGFRSVPKVTVTPAAGPAGTNVSVSMTGFMPRDDVDVEYTTGLPAPNDLAYVCDNDTALDGTTTCTGNIPAAGAAGARGPHQIVATGSTAGQSDHVKFRLRG